MGRTMNSKQRVRAAIHQEKVDRVPAYYEATDYVTEQLMARLGMTTFEELLGRLQIDLYEYSPEYIGPAYPVLKDPGSPNYQSTGLFGQKIHHVFNGIEYNSTVIEHPLDEAETKEDINRVNWPQESWFDYQSVPSQLDRIGEKGIIIGHWGPFQTSTYLRSEEKLYMDMALNPDLCHALFDRMHQFQMEHYERILKAAEGRVDILRTHDDYGTQRSLLFSQGMWEEYFAAHTRELCDLAHTYGAVFQQHSCGAVRPIIPGLIGCGVDGLEPIQPVDGMEPERLREAFDADLYFVGGIDTQHLLPEGNRESIALEVRRYINELGPSGYILYPSQAWESCISAETITYFYELDRTIGA